MRHGSVTTSGDTNRITRGLVAMFEFILERIVLNDALGGDGTQDVDRSVLAIRPARERIRSSEAESMNESRLFVSTMLCSTAVRRPVSPSMASKILSVLDVMLMSFCRQPANEACR